MASPFRFSLPLALGLTAIGLVAQAPTHHGIDPANLDTSVKPCQDFYHFANGGWLKSHTLPADKAMLGSFTEVMDRNREILKQILDETSAKRTWPKGSVQQKVGDFFASGMDEKAIEKRGLAPMKPIFATIDGLKDTKELPAVLAKLHNEGIPGGFGFYVGPDDKDSNRNLGAFHQGGLGLPDRDYYLNNDARTKDIRAKYVAHVAKMFELAGDPAGLAEARARVVLDLETKMAKAAWSRVELRDPQKTYNKMSLAKLGQEAPGFDWALYFKDRGVHLQDLNVGQPSYATAFAKLATDTPAIEWRTYLRWHALHDAASVLPKAFGAENFAFYGKVLSGTPEQETRWKRVEGMEDGVLGEALGQLYVKVAFPPESKQRMLQLVANLRSALHDRILALDWMSEATKQQAIHKLDAFTVKIGYPDKWKTYPFDVKRNDYFGNVLRASSYQVHHNLAKLGKPVDRTEWGMTPPTVNAYYNPSMNEIVFPAGILQPPFFDPKADDAVNYGAIGWVIGHEMTHGFDDQGRQFDAQGNLKNWWTPADIKAYQARTDLMVKQFDAYEPLKGQHVNGRLTLGENIADLGGMKIAYAAFMKSLNGKEPAKIDGFTAEQRFFLGAATIWRTLIRDAAASVRLKVDPHSPAQFRVNGPMSDLPEFYQAWGCKPGCPMRRPKAERPAIW